MIAGKNESHLNSCFAKKIVTLLVDFLVNNLIAKHEKDLKHIWPLKHNTVFRNRSSLKSLNCSCHLISLPPVLTMATVSSLCFVQATIARFTVCKALSTLFVLLRKEKFLDLFLGLSTRNLLSLFLHFLA